MNAPIHRPTSEDGPGGDRPGRAAGRLAGLGETVFARYSALAARSGGLNLGQGFPDEDGPAAVLEAARAAIAAGHNQYAPGIGIPALRAAVARHQLRHHGIALDPERQVVVTTGATEGIAAAMLAFVEPGDEVVVLEPSYDTYDAMIAMAGGRRRGVPLRAPDFRLDPDELAATVTDRTRVLVLNTPHNPTGRVLDAEELAAVAAVARRHDLVVVSDEVYEHLTFDGHRHVPVSTLPGMAGRTVTVSSLGKSWSLTGWKVGWVSGPSDLVRTVLMAKQWLTYTSGTPFQHAAVLALDEHDGFPRALATDLAARRDLLVDGLTGAGVPTSRPEGTYFVVSDVSTLGWEDGEAFCTALSERAGVVAIPLQGFFGTRPEAGRHLVRWAFCKRREVLEEALARLSAADLSA